MAERDERGAELPTVGLDEAAAGRAPEPADALSGSSFGAQPSMATADASPLGMTSPATNPIAAEPPRPSLFARAIAAARAWLFGGNTVARMGVLVERPAFPEYLTVRRALKWLARLSGKTVSVDWALRVTGLDAVSGPRPPGVRAPGARPRARGRESPRERRR